MRRLTPVALALLAALLPGEAVAAAPGWWDAATAWLFEMQRDFHRMLAVQLRAVSADGTASWALVGASLAYGVFHAAGPGHGKAVIAAYLLTQESRVKRGLLLAVAASFLQGAVAVGLVYGLISLAGWLPREMSSAVGWSERLGFLMLAGLGAVLAARGLRRLYTAWRGAAHPPGCGCGHHAHHGAEHRQPSAADWRDGLALVVSIGLRPCSGAVLVLVLAKAAGLAWAGVWAVVAMSAGTAATVAALAVLTVGARRWGAALLGVRTVALDRAGDAVAAAGGGLIAALALSLLAASFGPAHPLGL